MAFPTVTVEAAFGDAPFATTPTYTDLSTYARVATIKRGRPTNLARVEAATGAVELDNRDLRFDPLNTGSPYSPNVKPLVRFRISAVYNAVTYRLLTAYVHRWPPAGGAKVKTYTTVDLRDAFAVLANASLPADSYPAEATGLRIARTLDAVGFPAADRVLDPGTATVVAATIEADADAKALAHLLDVTETELGVFFIDGQGRAVFRDRHARFDDPADYTAVATFGDGGGSELQWDDVVPDFDVDKVVNDWRVTPSGGTVVTKEDSASITAYGRRSSTRSPLTEDANDATAQAEYLLATTKDPLVRWEKLVLRPSHFAAGALQDSLFAQALGREIGDRITVKVRPPGGAYTVSQDAYIEGIEHAIKDQDWTTTFLLSPADPNTVGGAGYWILADATYGVMDTTTRLAP